MQVQFDLATLALVLPVIVTLTQVLKGAVGWLGKRPALLPLASITLGEIVVGAVVLWRPEIAGAAGPARVGWWIVHGMVAGLMAAGLYDAAGKPITKAMSR